MKKETLFILGWLVFSILLLTSCHKIDYGNKCISHTNAKVVSATGPDSIMASQEADFTISYQFMNGCGFFEKLESNQVADTTIISVAARYEGCVCTEVLTGGLVVYKFKPLQPGVYYLKFLQREKNYLIDTITVN